MNFLPHKLKQITIIGDSNASRDAVALAEKVGSEVAGLGYATITGGRGGIMQAANKGAFEAGGLSIGILPSESGDLANRYCHIVIPTGIGHARNSITSLAGDAIVAIGGGAGTLSEICFSWIYQKPIFIFPQFGGWSEKLAHTSLDHRSSEPLTACDSPEDLSLKLKSLFRN